LFHKSTVDGRAENLPTQESQEEEEDEVSAQWFYISGARPVTPQAEGEPDEPENPKCESE